MLDMYEERRAELTEAAAEQDEHLIEKYLEEGELSPEEIRSALRKASLANELVPTLCGAALKNIGVQRVLDAVIDYLPSPVDVPNVRGTHPVTDEPLERGSVGRGAVVGGRVQDHGGPACWEASVFARLFGFAGYGRLCVQPAHWK